MRKTLLPLAACAALALAGCGDTLQQQPVPHNSLEGLMVAPFPVYWLGGTFHRLAVTGVEKDASGSYWVQYGNCVVGGQAECVTPLRIVTSPDNSFLPGGSSPRSSIAVRGVPAVLDQDGRTILVAAGKVVVDIYAQDAALAHAAALAIVPINAPGAPGARLPTPVPDTGYGSEPLPTQVPSPVRPLAPVRASG